MSEEGNAWDRELNALAILLHGGSRVGAVVEILYKLETLAVTESLTAELEEMIDWAVEVYGDELESYKHE